MVKSANSSLVVSRRGGEVRERRKIGKRKEVREGEGNLSLGGRTLFTGVKKGEGEEEKTR